MSFNHFKQFDHQLVETLLVGDVFSPKEAAQRTIKHLFPKHVIGGSFTSSQTIQEIFTVTEEETGTPTAYSLLASRLGLFYRVEIYRAVKLKQLEWENE